MKLIKIATLGTLALSIAGLSACNNMMPTKLRSQKRQCKANLWPV